MEPVIAPGSGPDDEGPAVEAPLERRLFNLKTLASFAAAAVIIVLTFSRINVDPAQVVAYIREANVGLYLLAFVGYYLTFPLRALRWQLLLANVGYRRSSHERLPSIAGLGEIIFLSWFVNCIVPAKLGDAYRGYLLKRNADVSFSRTMGTVLAERVGDMLVLFALMGISGLRLFGGHLPERVVSLFYAGFALALLIVGVLLAMRQFGRHVERMLPQRFRHFYVRFEEGTLQSFRNVPLLLLLTVAVWAVEAGRLWLILAALGLVNVSLMVVIFTALASSLLTTLPVTPGGLGLVESGMIGILLLLNSLGLVQGVSQSLATSTAILDRSINYWSLVVIGLVVYLVTRKK